MVVELAHQVTPTLDTYYKTGLGTIPYGTALGFIADIADGLSALHMCGVVHGDLKPENVLLFDDPGEKGSLIAKLGDFGFSNIDFLNEPVRGRTEHWDAPERLDGCPESITVEAENLEWPKIACDVYSFGLIVGFIALEGVGPLSQEYLREWTGVINTSKADEISLEDVIRQLKFSDRARFTIEEEVQAYYNRIGCQGRRLEPESCREYIALLHDTLQSVPSNRIASLSAIRQRMMGR